MANSVDPDQLAWKPTDLDLYCLQMQGISRFSRTRVKATVKEFTEAGYIWWNFAIIYKETTSVTFCCSSAYHAPSEKGSTL